MNNLKKINDELLQASMTSSLVKMGDDFVAAVTGLTESSDEDEEVEEFMCPECKEWTDTESMCCGVGPASYCEDSLNGDR